METKQSITTYKTYLEQTKKFYDNKFGVDFSLNLNEEEQSRWKMIRREIEKVLAEGGEKKFKILDSGCGNGRFSNLLATYGQVKGVDLSESAILLAKLNFASIDFYVADLCDEDSLKHCMEKFDMVVSTEVIEHLLNQDGYIKNTWKLLSNGGTLIITTPNGRWHKNFFSGREKQLIENWLTKKEMIALLMKEGFKVEKVKEFNSDWLFSQHRIGLLKLLFNRHIKWLLNKLKLKNAICRALNLSGFGIYLIVVAKKA